MNKPKLRIEPLTLREKILRDKRLAAFAEKQAKQNDPGDGGYWMPFNNINQRINAMLLWLR